MTLTTSIRVVEPTPYRPIFAEANRLLGSERAKFRENEAENSRDNPGIWNEPGQGFAAWLMLEYGGDGPLKDDPGYCTLDDCEVESTGFGKCTRPEHHVPSQPAASIEVSFDTTYSYRAANGAGCADLHAWLILELGKYLDARDLTWYWYDEYRGEWHKGYDGLSTFGNPAKGSLTDSQPASSGSSILHRFNHIYREARITGRDARP